jgi:hypothetical protein
LNYDRLETGHYELVDPVKCKQDTLTCDGEKDLAKERPNMVPAEFSD